MRLNGSLTARAVKKGNMELKRFLYIGLMGLLLGLAVNGLRGDGLPLLPEAELTTEAGGADTLATAASETLAIIGFEEADALYRKELAIFVDSRELSDYESGHIAGAISVPLSAYRDGDAKLLAPKGSLLVIYCIGGDCELSHDLARLLVADGFKKVRVYVGGYEEWDALGMPVE